MGTIQLKKVYRHSEDCLQTGCPSHEATFTYQSTSDAYTFDTGCGRIICFERGELEVFLSLLSQMNERNACCVDVKKHINFGDNVLLPAVLLDEIIEYIEEREKVIEEEWGSCQSVKEMIDSNSMPDLYDQILALKNGK